MKFGSGDADGSASAMFDDEMLCNSLELIPGPSTLALLTLIFAIPCVRRWDSRSLGTFFGNSLAVRQVLGCNPDCPHNPSE